MHVPHVMDAVRAGVVVLLNLSRDQLDRVGEINHIERTLRGGSGPASRRGGRRQLRRRADDVGGLRQPARRVGGRRRRLGERLGELPAQRRGHRARRIALVLDGRRLQAAQPAWWFYDDTHVYGPDGLTLPMTLALPGAVNRGNATQAVAAAVALGADPASAVAAVSARRRGGRPLPHRATGAAHRARCCWPRTRPAGRRRCRWSTSTARAW